MRVPLRFVCAQGLWFDEGEVLFDTRSGSAYDEDWKATKRLEHGQPQLTADRVREATSAQVDITALMSVKSDWHRGSCSAMRWGDSVQVTGKTLWRSNLRQILVLLLMFRCSDPLRGSVLGVAVR